MLTKHATRGIYTLQVWENPPETPYLTTPTTSKNNMESQPFQINITLNQEGNGALLHANPKSDARASRWPMGYEEAESQAKQVWLGKLGCLLKLHGNIKCQWSSSPRGTNTNIQHCSDTFNDPWAYKISDFPENYKLFSAGRRGSPLRMDHYLHGMFFLLLNMLSNQQLPSRWKTCIQITTGVLPPLALVT